MTLNKSFSFLVPHLQNEEKENSASVADLNNLRETSGYLHTLCFFFIWGENLIFPKRYVFIRLSPNELILGKTIFLSNDHII